MLILLRDPLERFRSGLTHQLATSSAPLEHRDIQGAFARSLYAPQLRRVLAAFPSEQVHVGQYEACRADPAAELARTYAFLGPRAVRTRRGRASRRAQPDDLAEVRAARRPAARRSSTAGRPTSQQLPGLVPGLDLSLWPSARELGLA